MRGSWGPIIETREEYRKRSYEEMPGWMQEYEDDQENNWPWRGIDNACNRYIASGENCLQTATTCICIAEGRQDFYRQKKNYGYYVRPLHET